jgi:hypothetical protein
LGKQEERMLQFEHCLQHGGTATEGVVVGVGVDAVEEGVGVTASNLLDGTKQIWDKKKSTEKNLAFFVRYSLAYIRY